EATELPDRLVDHLPAELGLRDVSAQQQAAHAVLLDERLRLPGIAVLVEVDHGDIRSRLREGDRHGAADAAIAARDQRHAIPELAPALRGRVLGLRPRFHSGLESWSPILRLRRTEMLALFRLALVRHPGSPASVTRPRARRVLLPRHQFIPDARNSPAAHAIPSPPRVGRPPQKTCGPAKQLQAPLDKCFVLLSVGSGERLASGTIRERA